MIQQETVDVSDQRENLERIQSVLRRFLADYGIAIESNPTSNWLIGGFERHGDVPAIQWQLRHPDLAITINSDDPAVFSTNLENEFFFTFVALRRGDSELPGLSRTEA